VGYVTPAGVIQEFPTSGGIASLCLGSDGNIWFTEFSTDKIGRVTPAGVVTEFNVPTANAQPEGIALGTSNLYFAEFGSTNPGRLGQITTGGIVTESAQIPTLPQLDNVAMGPDGRMWVSEPFAVGTMMLDAFSQATLTDTQYAIPGGAQLRNIVSGPLGDLWIIDAANVKIDKVNTSGTFLTQYAVNDTLPGGLAVGVDGNLYYGGSGSNLIGALTTAGVETDYPIPTGGAHPIDLTSGPDGNIWFAEFSTNKIGRLIL
jgi:streptogramin lyase